MCNKEYFIHFCRGPKTDFVVTGGLDGLIKVWKLENNKLELLHTLQGHTMAVVSVSISPDGHSKCCFTF